MVYENSEKVKRVWIQSLDAIRLDFSTYNYNNGHNDIRFIEGK